MWRWIPAVVLSCLAPVYSQSSKPDQSQSKGSQGELQRERQKPPTSSKQEIPPEEDRDITTESYAFNPLQAQKEVQTGNYYFKKGSFRAAAGRYREATKWNESFGEAWLRLGETEEKLKDSKAAREAYAKYLEVASDARNAPEIRKRLEKLK